MTQSQRTPGAAAHTRAASRLAAAVALATLALVLPASALASSIVYTDGAGNVWLTTPDGSTKKQVTRDDKPDDTYRNPSQADDGTIVGPRTNRFIYVLNQDGTSKRGPWLTPGTSCSSSTISTAVTPAGGLFAYFYIHSDFCSGGSGPRARVAIGDTGTGTSNCNVFPCHDGYFAPRWIHGTSYAGMITISGDQVHVQSQSGLQPWVDSGGRDFESFDLSRSGNRVLFELTPDGTPGEGQTEVGELTLWQNNGPPPSGGNAVCTLGNFGTGNSDPRWSPDGTQFTWEDAQGIWVSPAPVAGQGGACTIQPKLIVPGGKDPDWGPANVPGGGTAPDRDGDGRPDSEDRCPDQPASTTDGCPAGEDADVLRPVLSAFTIRPSAFRFRVGSTTISFRLSEAARVTFTFERVLPGRRLGGRCVAPGRRTRRARRCTRYLRVGSISRASAAGPNSLRFSGRLRGRALPVGAYRLTATGVDPAGNRSLPVRRGFRIVPARGR